MKKEQKHTILWLFGSMIMMMAGFVLMPKFIKIVSAKLYKCSHGEIVIDEEKPVIFKKYTTLGEK